LLLGCGQGALRLEVVQPPGGKPMAADAYLRGHSLPKL
jgi:methionyl-tRNA formyltransferase